MDEKTSWCAGYYPFSVGVGSILGNYDQITNVIGVVGGGEARVVLLNYDSML